MNLANSVAKTIAYSAFFHFPLSPQEVHYWLITSRPISPSSVKKYLHPLSSKDTKLRETLNKTTLKKIFYAQKLLKYAWLFPSIKLIALTGSVSANNSHKNDDLDLLIVTSQNTLWLTRPFFLLFLSLKFNRRHPGDITPKETNSFCPNLWLDTASLSVPQTRRNLYTAHEVLQTLPLFDRGDTHARFIKQNCWTSRYLANAYQEISRKGISQKKSEKLCLFFAPLNFFLYILQYLYMLPKKTTEVVSIHSAFFHKKDLSQVLTQHLDHNSL